MIDNISKLTVSLTKFGALKLYELLKYHNTDDFVDEIKNMKGLDFAQSKKTFQCTKVIFFLISGMMHKNVVMII